MKPSKDRQERVSLKRALVIIALTLAAVLASIATAFAWEEGDVYKQTNLVSDLPDTAKVTDPNLKNPWGIIHSLTSPWWVNDNGTGVSTVYNGSGTPFPVAAPLIVTVPPPNGAGGAATPTGIIANGTKDFELAPGFPARFIFVTEDGTISGWNPSVPAANSTSAVLKVDNSPSAVYKGAAMALNGGALFIYVANFRGGTVDVFDSTFTKVTPKTGAFTDQRVPSGFAPFNVMNISGRLVVTYAKQDAAKHDDVAGKGFGYVDVFDPDGTLLMRLEHGPWLNSPWGVALAPAGFGVASKRLLVGNFGSGQIATFDAVDGSFKGLLKGVGDKPIVINGLWGLGFGNGGNAGPYTTLFFAAGLNDEKDGLFGTLTPAGGKKK